MSLPRWGAFPALPCLAALVLAGERAGASAPANADPSSPRFERVVVLGIDGMDPDILAEVIDRFPDRMPNFRALARESGIQSLRTSIPPQSPVAWSNFITGLNPGGHGVFDFIHRDPVHRTPIPSTSTIGDDPLRVGLWSDWQLQVPLPWRDAPGDNRTGKAFWAILADHGVPADIWRMPANIPVIPSRGLSFPGMLTPALDSAYGEFSFFTTDPPVDLEVTGGRIVPVSEFDGRIDARLSGPPNEYKDGSPPASAALTFHLDREAKAVVIEGGDRTLVLQPGEWSDFVRVSFDKLPMGLSGASGIVRFYLRRIDPAFELYASPVNIDPLDPVIPVSHPSSASASLADRSAGGIGLYYTQGMPEEVNALKSGVFSDLEFLDQVHLVYDEQRALMDYALDQYLARQEGGLLFFYCATMDLCCHMLWRHFDTDHPHHDAQFDSGSTETWSGRPGSSWKEVIHDVYLRMDPLLGTLRERLGDEVTLIVMSDHGFAPWRRKFSLNTWLLENGYLVLKPGLERELPSGDPAHQDVFVFAAADWSKTRAYGVGFNGLYLNLAGRERDDPKTPENESGIVQPGEAEALLSEIAAKLEALVDPQTEEHVVLRCDAARRVYQGERVSEAPDLIVGYNAGYGNSDPSTLARIPHAVLEDNRGGTFNGNHLMAPEVVPGVLLSNRLISPGEHGLEDLTVEVLARYGIRPLESMQGHRVLREQP